MPDAARIAAVRLRCSTPLGRLRDFYEGTMGLPALQQGPELSLQAGATELTFVEEGGAAADPFYHLAFNVPENRILEARSWQRRRTPLLTPGAEDYAALRDPDMPDDVVSFAHWNAHSVFFRDPAGNLLEHIARHELDNDSEAPFTAEGIQCVSELALVVDDVPGVAGLLASGLRLSPYREISSGFAALGDARGLLLVFRRGRNLGFDDGTAADVFPLEIALRGTSARSVEIPGYPYRIRQVPGSG